VFGQDPIVLHQKSLDPDKAFGVNHAYRPTTPAKYRRWAPTSGGRSEVMRYLLFAEHFAQLQAGYIDLVA